MRHFSWCNLACPKCYSFSRICSVNSPSHDSRTCNVGICIELFCASPQFTVYKLCFVLFWGYGNSGYKCWRVMGHERGAGREAVLWWGWGVAYRPHTIRFAEIWPASPQCKSLGHVDSSVSVTPLCEREQCFWVHAITRGWHAVAWLVEALWYTPRMLRFRISMRSLNFSIYLILTA
jgi:hypothetical protein